MEGDLQKESVCCFILTYHVTQDMGIQHIWYWVVTRKFTFQFSQQGLWFQSNHQHQALYSQYQEKHAIRNVSYKIQELLIK